MEKESFKLEFVLSEGEIVDVIPLDDDVNISKPAGSLIQFPDDEKRDLLRSLQHGSIILSGQNSPGWLVFRTAHGYTKIWR